MALYNSSQDATSNLNHIYFFIDPATSQCNANHADDSNVSTAPAQTSTPQHSRASSSVWLGGVETSTAASASSTSDMNPLAESFIPQSTKSQPSNPLATPFEPCAKEVKVFGPPPPPTASQLYELRETEDKGFGLFATCYIKRGTLIICESPLLQIQDNALHLVWRPYCRLSKSDKETFDVMHSFQPVELELEFASRCFLIDSSDRSLSKDDIEELVQDQVRVMSIFSANNFGMSPKGLAVYATASRLNHSCVPNVHHSYNPTLKQITVHANQDIYPDQELLTTYIGGEGTYQVRSQRIERLRSSYDFTCQCPACSDGGKVSDGRRELMNHIAWGLQQYNEGVAAHHPFIPANVLSALKQAEDLVAVMLQEGIFTLELTKAYRMASKQALALHDFDKALQYGYTESEVERNCLGTQLKDLRKLGVASEIWIEQVYAVITKEKGEEFVRKLRDEVRERKKKEHRKQGKDKSKKNEQEKKDGDT